MGKIQYMNLEKLQKAEALLFILEFRKNTRLKQEWKQCISKLGINISGKTSSNLSNNSALILDNIIQKYGFNAKYIEIVAVLKSPFFTDDRSAHFPNDASKKFVKDVLNNIKLFIEWKAVVYDVMDGDAGGMSSINSFLSSKGYSCNAIQVNASFFQLRNSRLAYWSGIYTDTVNIAPDGKEFPGSILSVYGAIDVAIGKAEIIRPVYKNGVISWNLGDDPDLGNQISGEVYFTQNTRASSAEPKVGCGFFGHIIYPENSSLTYKNKVSYRGQIEENLEDVENKLPNLNIPAALSYNFKEKKKVFRLIQQYLVVCQAIDLLTAVDGDMEALHDILFQDIDGWEDWRESTEPKIFIDLQSLKP